ncbi:MAG: hypothetical protein AB7U38_14040 [Hyphomicrobiales bacterium]
MRIRVQVPEGGFGRQANELHAWLRARAGDGGYAVHSDVLPGRPDALCIYLLDASLAAEMMREFDLLLAAEG